MSTTQELAIKLLEETLRAEVEDLDTSMTELLGENRVIVQHGVEGLGDIYVRKPSTTERDDADMYRNITRARLTQDPEIKSLAALPISDEERAAIEADIEVIAKRMESTSDRNQKRWYRQRLQSLYDALASNQMNIIVERRSDMAWHRWLSERLLVDADGEPFIDGERTWDSLPPALQDAATVATAKLMRLINRIPFASAPQSEPASD